MLLQVSPFLIFVWEGRTKSAIESVGFGNTLLVAQLRLKSVLDKPQIKSPQRASLWEFHQQIKLKFNTVIVI